MAGRRKTHMEFIQELRSLVGDEYIALGKYKNKRTKLIMKHNIDGCNHEWEVMPGNILYAKTRCPKCSVRLQTKTHKKFMEEVKELVGTEYTILGKYKNSQSNILMKHNVEGCDHEWKPRPADFLQGKRCPKCAGSLKKTTDSYKSEVFELLGSEYSVLGEFINSSTKILMKHNKESCGYEWKVFPYSITHQGTRCPQCFGNPLKTTEIFKREVFKLVGSEYLVLGEYKNSVTHITMKHNIENCGYEWKVKPNNFIFGTRCPRCLSSKGEVACGIFLLERNIKFVEQFRINDCRHLLPLPFDFAIINENGESLALLEYDGKQHFMPIDKFGGEDGFKETQRRDAIKTKYCADNGIPLIRISYWDYDNIDAILTEKLLPLLYNVDKSNAS